MKEEFCQVPLLELLSSENTSVVSLHVPAYGEKLCIVKENKVIDHIDYTDKYEQNFIEWLKNNGYDFYL